MQEVTPKTVEKFILEKILDPQEAERTRKVFEGYGSRLAFDVMNVLLHAVDKEKVGEVLWILERHYQDDLQYQHPGIRGTVGQKTERVLIRICRDTLELQEEEA